MTTRHDEEVKRAVLRLKRRGFRNIKADLPSYEQPEPVGQKGFIPDFLASKPGKIVIGEIEEEKQMPSQLEQISAFRRSAAQSRNKEFMLISFQKRKKGVSISK